MPGSIHLAAIIERNDPKLPRFIVVPRVAIAPWKLTETTTLTGALNGHDMGRGSLKKWNDRRWFIELPQPLCQVAQVNEGDRVTLDIRLASDELPVELANLLASDPAAKQSWERLTPSSRRMLRENVAAARQSVTRARRAFIIRRIADASRIADALARRFRRT
jgi:hypothetical protein